MLYEIKSRWSGLVLFSLECASLKLCVEAAVKAGADLAGADLARADLARACLAGAYLARADLAGADLAGTDLAGACLARADLDGANLDGANLAGAYLARAYLAGTDLARAYLAGACLARADLDGAKWRNGIVLQHVPIQIYGLEDGRAVTILDEHMEIGCELHTFAAWRKFKDSRIKLMDDRALAFWKRCGPALLALCATREVEAAKEAA